MQENTARVVMCIGMMCELYNNKVQNTEGDYTHVREVVYNTYKSAYDREEIEICLRQAWDTYFNLIEA